MRKFITFALVGVGALALGVLAAQMYDDFRADDSTALPSPSA